VIEFKEYLKLLLATLLTLSLVLFSWLESYDKYSLSLIFPLIILLFISYGLIEIRVQERRCIKRCYFKEKSIITRILSSKIFLTIFSIIISILMSISISYSVISFTLNWWLYLLLHSMVATFLYLYIIKITISLIKEPYNRIFAKEWSGYIMLLSIIPIFVYSTLNGYVPPYIETSLEQTIMNASISISSNCEITDYIFKISREIDAILWWLILNSTAHIEQFWLRGLIWIGFILYNSLVLFGINRLIVETIHIIDIIFTKR